MSPSKGEYNRCFANAVAKASSRLRKMYLKDYKRLLAIEKAKAGIGKSPEERLRQRAKELGFKLVRIDDDKV